MESYQPVLRVLVFVVFIAFITYVKFNSGAMAYAKRGRATARRGRQAFTAAAEDPGVPAGGPVVLHVWVMGINRRARQTPEHALTVAGGTVRLVGADGEVVLDAPVGEVTFGLGQALAPLAKLSCRGKKLTLALMPRSTFNANTTDDGTPGLAYDANRIRLALGGRIPSMPRP